MRREPVGWPGGAKRERYQRSNAIREVNIGKILEACLKRRIALQIGEQVSEDSVVENAIADAEGGLAVAERIPGQPKRGSKFVGIGHRKSAGRFRVRRSGR